jgi:hypothetical protein
LECFMSANGLKRNFPESLIKTTGEKLYVKIKIIDNILGKCA